MKNTLGQLLLLCICVSAVKCSSKDLDFEQHPSTVISNDAVQMKVYPPDPEKGLYRATRFDWSGIIGSVQYKGHEYFGYWKKTHDPLFHEDIAGPVEGFIAPGLGYDDAEPGEGFIRIGVGIIEKPGEPEYNWMKTYRIMDNGIWKTEQGKDWITFTHELESDLGYGYVYEKSIHLKSNGFFIQHRLKNTGEKAIETDQFNHNFFMIDGEKSGPAFSISFPFPVTTSDDMKGFLEIRDRDLYFIKKLRDASVLIELGGYSSDTGDHKVTVKNSKSGAGVTFTVDKPLSRLVFWACETTLCPENSIWIYVEPGGQEHWVSDYTLFVD